MIVPIQQAAENNQEILEECQILKPDNSLEGKGYVKEQTFNSILECQQSNKQFKFISIADFLIRLLIIIQFFTDSSNIYNILLFISCIVISLIQILQMVFKCSLKSLSIRSQLLHSLCHVLQFDLYFFSLAFQSKFSSSLIYRCLDYKILTRVLKSLVSQFYLKRLFFGIRGLILMKKLIAEDQINFSIIDYVALLLNIIVFFYINFLYVTIFVNERKYNFIQNLSIAFEQLIAFSLSIILVVGVFEIGYISYLITLMVFSLIILKLELSSGKLFDPFKVGCIDQILLGGQLTYLLPLLKKDYNSLQMLINIPLNKIHTAIFALYQIIIQVQILLKIVKDEETSFSDNQSALYFYLITLTINSSLIICKTVVWGIYLAKKKSISVSDFSQINLAQINQSYHVELTITNKEQQFLEEKDYQVINHLMNFNGGFLSISFNHQFLIQVMKGHIEIIFDYISKREQADKLYLMALNSQKSINIDIIFEQSSKKQINLFLMTVLKNNIIENEVKHLQNRQYFVNYFKKFNQVQEVIPISEALNNQISGATLSSIVFQKHLSTYLLNNPKLVSYDLYEDL